ncbi:MAG: hypothetical protein LBC09_05730 [Helicobacteraceae bacterium]|jgi:hypothetical protein|nr:hypothetical protein [Helicobacteraceae bacterium]
MRLYKTAAAFLILALPALAQEAPAEVETQAPPPSAAVKPAESGEYIIPNDPILKPTHIITIRAIGMGVAKEGYSRAQQMAMAKRAAILDGYRQLGEKLHGVKITSRDTVKDAMLLRSEVRAEVYSVIRGAEIVETIWDNDLCQVEMEVKIDGRRWYRALAGLTLSKR